ncbi:DUF4435 domain-containing protein [Acinetobacter sp. I-MWF]|uniref:DUF4435 domain-containing protein n=1 Tax=Acinetobacter sp. I-MWF TaxID=2940517 RepID=UPI0021C8F9B3|nr:DUF4435 domain-containing protein [Acinetobacter sp. I-MWF]MCT9977269.1 DUF4435 domain-containing protein [Acinetobacter sp. I-MWF]
MSAIFPTTQELITEIVSLTGETKPWLIVEGESDVRFFEQRFNLKRPITYEERKGWEGVVDLLKEWNILSEQEKKGQKVIGVIDRDYHEVIGTDIPDNIVIVDHRDLEIFMFECDEALHKVISELGSFEKLPHINGKLDLNQVRQVIYKLAYPLSKLRFFNALKSEVNLTFKKPFDFKKIVDLKPLNLDSNELIRKISIDSCCQIEILANLITEDVEKPWNSHQKISNGHDVMCLLGKSLQKHFGTISDSKFVEGDRIEGLFRMAYPNNEFENSKFGIELMMLLGLIEQKESMVA